MNNKKFIYMLVLIFCFFVYIRSANATNINQENSNVYFVATARTVYMEREDMTELWKSLENAVTNVDNCLKKELNVDEQGLTDEGYHFTFVCTSSSYITKLKKLKEVSADILNKNKNYTIPYFNNWENRFEANDEYWTHILGYIETYYNDYKKNGAAIYEYGIKNDIIDDNQLQTIKGLHSTIIKNNNTFLSMKNTIRPTSDDEGTAIIAPPPLACEHLGTQTIELIQKAFTVIKIFVPLLLILLGSFDLANAVLAGSNEEIKKVQKTLMQRILAGIAIYFVPALLNLILGFLGITDATCSIS